MKEGRGVCWTKVVDLHERKEFACSLELNEGSEDSKMGKISERDVGHNSNVQQFEWQGTNRFEVNNYTVEHRLSGTATRALLDYWPFQSVG